VAVGLVFTAWGGWDAGHSRGNELIKCRGGFGVNVSRDRARNRLEDWGRVPDRLEVRDRSEGPSERTGRVVGYQHVAHALLDQHARLASTTLDLQAVAVQEGRMLMRILVVEDHLKDREAHPEVGWRDVREEVAQARRKLVDECSPVEVRLALTMRADDKRCSLDLGGIAEKR
jgi:hypothetical protein